MNTDTRLSGNESELAKEMRYMSTYYLEQDLKLARDLIRRVRFSNGTSADLASVERLLGQSLNRLNEDKYPTVNVMDHPRSVIPKDERK